MIRILKLILLWLWQLPQNIVGLLILWWLGNHKWVHGTYLEDRSVTVWAAYNMSGGISLGNIVIISIKMISPQCISHELGHCRQSRMLGPLYLPVVGIPSIMWAWLHKWIAPKKSYYWFYTEKWADRLGGVVR